MESAKNSRQGSQVWAVLPQIVVDPATGMTLNFSVSSSGELILTLIGDLPFGNREFIFARDGNLAGTGLLPRV